MISVELFLPDEAATSELGRIAAHGLVIGPPYPPILLEGDLGAGKTTLVRGLVQSLPGADTAEVGSPSFNIMNLYPTRPEIAHFDLYRLEFMYPGDEFFDSLDMPERLTIVEWAQYLSEPNRPKDALRLIWKHGDHGRTLVVQSTGERSTTFLENMRPELSASATIRH